MEGHTITNDELSHRFEYHPPVTPEAQHRHEKVRSGLLAMAIQVVEQTGPPSREQSLAVTKLEEAMFWANAAIAREILAPQEE